MNDMAHKTPKIPKGFTMFRIGILGSDNRKYATKAFFPGLYTFEPGDELRLRVIANSSFAQTLDFTAEIEFEYK